MKKILLLLPILCAFFTLNAQWSTNPNINNTFYTGNIGAYETQAATDAATGNTYINWFILEAGGMHPKLQMVNVFGETQWQENGIYVSTHPSQTALFGTALTVSTDGCAVLMFCDERNGSYVPYAYKISPTGEFVWGADGIQITTADALRCYLYPCNDGSVWAAWTDGSICCARHISSDGQTLGPIVTVSDPNAQICFGHIVTDDDNNMIMAYYSSTGYFLWPDRTIYACKYDVNGEPVWDNHIQIMNAYEMNFARDLNLVADGLGGGYVSCYVPMLNDLHQVIVFHFDANGMVSTPLSGVRVSTNDIVNNYNEDLTVDPTNNNLIISFVSSTSNETQFQIRVQSVDVNGNKLWGDVGKTLTSMAANQIFDVQVSSVSTGGAIITYNENDNIKAIRIDEQGQEVWDEVAILSSSSSNKSSSDFTTGVNNGQIIVPWIEEDYTVKAQNMKLDGTIGPVEINDPIVGDANEDGVVDVTDIQSVIAYILETGNQINIENADANDDDTIDVLDIMLIVNIIF